MTTDIRATLEERGKTHGDYSVQAHVAMMLRRTLFANWSGHQLSDVQQSALTMISEKLARIVCGNPNEPDHWRDIAGYATLAADRCALPLPRGDG